VVLGHIGLLAVPVMAGALIIFSGTQTYPLPRRLPVRCTYKRADTNRQTRAGEGLGGGKTGSSKRESFREYVRLLCDMKT
jgi:hypothetical protein